jgi:hypothetical protein
MTPTGVGNNKTNERKSEDLRKKINLYPTSYANH